MRKKEEKRTGDAQIHVENEEMSGSDVSDSEVSEMIDGEDGVEGMGFGHEMEENGHAIGDVVRREIAQNEELVLRHAVDDQHDRTTNRLATWTINPSIHH